MLNIGVLTNQIEPTMTDELTNFDERPVGRPTFLTVLCILTFIGSGWGLISGGISYMNADKTAAQMSATKQDITHKVDSTKSNDDGQKFAERIVSSMTDAFTPDKIRKSSIASIVAAILCLAGAFMMWQLKKTGFYSYLAGTLIGVIAPFVIFGSGSFFAIAGSAIAGFIGILFVILYAVNLKHMR